MLDRKVDEDKTELSVYLHKGKIKLYTENTNYSGGELKKTFKKALQNINFKKEESILILGFGLGSIWEIIREDKKVDSEIIGVEKEAQIENWINEYSPKINTDKNTKIHYCSSADYLNQTNKIVDYILVDLFIDQIVYPPAYSYKHIKAYHKNLKPGGLLVFNTMGNLNLKDFFPSKLFNLQGVEKINKTNHIYYFTSR